MKLHRVGKCKPIPPEQQKIMPPNKNSGHASGINIDVKGKGKGDSKTCFSVGVFTVGTVYIHYFKHISQGALQS